MRRLFTLIALLLCLVGSASAAKKKSKTAQPETHTVTGEIGVSKTSNMEWVLRYEAKDIATLRERAKSEPSKCDVMFFGSSSIRLWKSLKQDMAPLTVVNRGYGGATLRDLHYNYKTVMAHYRPKAFVIYCDNDLRTSPKTNITVGELFDLYRLLFQRLEKDYPGVPVYLLAMKHCQRREAIRDRQAAFNLVMKEYASVSNQVTFVDTCTPLLTEEGKIDPSLFLDDRIHLNAAGYAIWTKVLRPLLIK